MKQEAEARARRNASKPSERVLVENHHLVGLAGEWAFAKFAGIMPDLSIRKYGDNGIDFVVNFSFPLDVKTATRGNRLLLEHNKPVADIYVLAKFDETTQTAELVGWEWGAILKRIEPKDTGRKITNHALHMNKLRSMAEFQRYLNKQIPGYSMKK